LYWFRQREIIPSVISSVSFTIKELGLSFGKNSVLEFIIGLLITFTATQSFATEKITLPKFIQANYEVTKNDQPFAKVKEQFTITGNTYSVESVTKGIGVYALLGERKLISKGEVNAEGLRPSHFELHQGDNVKKSLLADFDWAKNTLNMTVKGKLKTATLVTGTQDLASYAYQFMYMKQPLKDSVTVMLTTGKKLNIYNYAIANESETIETTNGDAPVIYKTLRLTEHDATEANAEKSDSKSLWLSPEHYYLPVRILLVDESDQKIEQTLTSLHVE